MKGLSPRQKQILDYIKEYQEKNSIQPSIQETAAALSLEASYVAYAINVAIAKGYAERLGHRYLKFMEGI